MSQKIFFHVGLSKTGSTFLQQQIFPKLEGIKYLPTVKYRNALKLLPEIDAELVLVSREFDQQFEREIKKFAKQYPKAYPIIVLREPSSWAVSNYKRFVKNGHPISFSEFIDLKEDKGLFKLKDFDFHRYLNLLDQHFLNSPLILFYEDLKLNPHNFTHQLLNYTGTTLNFKNVNWTPHHVSYDENSLKLVRKLSERIQFQKKLEVHIKPKGFLYNLYANTIRYSILYGSKAIPNAWFPKEEFINSQDVINVKEHFSKAWTSIREENHEI